MNLIHKKHVFCKLFSFLDRSTSFGSEHEIAYGRIPTRYNRIHGVSSPTTGSKNSYKIWYHHGETDYEHGSTSEPQPAVRLEEPIRTDVDYGVGTEQMRKKENHLFKWVDEALLDEIERMAEHQARVDEEIEDLRISMKKTVQKEVMNHKHSLDVGVPDPRRPLFPVHITANLSSQSTRSQTQEEDASDVLSAHQRSDAKPSDPDQTRLVSARDRSCLSHLVFVRGSLGGPGSTICKTKLILILRT
ncbi:hypothetical protein F2Q69_00022765 [Brassica cretica]|uniref:Uncharacterized protein n=1 Tax=Brassica cretica TaxID=69181 RepID=A0A8S9QN88_BRACR|nr:hypothetical protein F2Q69_00022765 [Brassica cretica]